MFKNTKAFNGFSVNDLAAAKKFYGDMLGIELEENPMGLQLKIAGGNTVYIYSKPNHEPATFTILNFPVENIDKAVEGLKGKEITFEHYENFPQQEESGILRGIAAKRGPDIAWFKDPAGNILSVLQEK